MRPFQELTTAGQLRRLRRLALEALSAYSVREPRLVLVSHGHNTLFRVDLPGGERRVLRIQRPGWGNVASVRSELMWLAALNRDTDLAVPEPVRTNDGDMLTVVQVEGVPEPRICILFGWIEGRFMYAGLTPAHLKRVGELTAQLQVHAAQFTPPNAFTRGRLYSLTTPANIASRSAGETLVRQQFRDLEDEAAAIQLVGKACSAEDAERTALCVGKIRAAQRAVGYGPDAYGLIHADLHHNNTFYHRGEVRAIDFDDCGYGHHLYDMAVTLAPLRRRDDASALTAGLLAGYRSVQPLSAEHESHLDAFIMQRVVQDMVWRIETRDEPHLRDRWRSLVQPMLDDVREFVER